MNLAKQKLLARLYRNQAGEGGDGGSGQGAGNGGEGGQGAGGAAGAGANGAGDGKSGSGEGGTGGDGTKGAGNKPSDAEAKLIQEVMDKKNALKATKEQLAAVETKLKEFEGIDPVAVRELLKQQKELEQKKLEDKGEWDKLKAQMVEESNKVVEALKGDLSAKDAELQALRNQISELTIGNAFTGSKFITEELTLTPAKTRVIYGQHFEFQDGKVVAFDKPASAKDRTVLVDAQGEPLQFEAALKKLVEIDPERDQLLRSKMKPGAGSKPAGDTKAPTGNLVGRSKIAAGLQNLK